MRSAHISFVAVIGLIAATVQAEDWPQWLGPARNGSSPEIGLRTVWPAEGPRVLWKISGGRGYSSVVVAGGRAFTMVERDAGEVALALDAATGRELWATRCGPAYKDVQANSGPRSTPAVEGGHLYVQSVSGPLLCLEVEAGTVVWQHDTLKDFNVKNLDYGMSASPLVEADFVVTVPGAPGASAVAYHKLSGKLAWKTGDDRASYSSPVALTIAGRRQIAFFTWTSFWGVQAEDGKQLWSVAWPGVEGHLGTPLVVGDRLFASSYTPQGGAMFKFTTPTKPTIVWESPGTKGDMRNVWPCPVVFEGHLCGTSGGSVFDLNCVEMATGKLVWAKDRFGRAAVTLADSHMFLLTEAGELVLVSATPRGFREKGRVKLLGKGSYATPAIAGRRLFLRDHDHIVCLDLREPTPDSTDSKAERNRKN